VNITAYDVLGISVNASLDDVKHAYIRLAKRYHPDVCSESDALDRMKNINLAYEAIRDGRGRWWSPPIPQAAPEPSELPSLAEMLEFANTHVVEDDYLISIFVGGRDAYSKLRLPDLEQRAGEEIVRRVRSALRMEKLRGTALRWYLRGLTAVRESLDPIHENGGSILIRQRMLENRRDQV
jgi:hypothetical protein